MNDRVGPPEEATRLGAACYDSCNEFIDRICVASPLARPEAIRSAWRPTSPVGVGTNTELDDDLIGRSLAGHIRPPRRTGIGGANRCLTRAKFEGRQRTRVRPLSGGVSAWTVTNASPNGRGVARSPAHQRRSGRSPRHTIP